MERNRGPLGPVSSFPEADYRFGVGTLRMRVERIDWQRPLRYDDETWYEVVGMEVTADGREVGRRQTLVRARNLAALRGNTPRH
jgi:hypothetical protein